MSKAKRLTTTARADSPLQGSAAEPSTWRQGDTPMRRLVDDLLPGRQAGVAARRLGRQIREWREAHGISQQELATRLGMAQPNVARLEGGGVAPTLTTLALLTERLGVRVTVEPGEDAPAIVITDAVPAA